MQSKPPSSGWISMPAVELKRNESNDFSQVMCAEPQQSTRTEADVGIPIGCTLGAQSGWLLLGGAVGPAVGITVRVVGLAVDGDIGPLVAAAIGYAGPAIDGIGASFNISWSNHWTSCRTG